MGDKVDLERPVEALRTARSLGWSVSAVTASWPLYRSSRGRYAHLIRSATTHWHRNSTLWRTDAHVSFKFWCGNIGTGKNATLIADIGGAGLICAECRARFMRASNA